MENNTSILVKNYHKKHPEDSPHTTLVEFFSFCGTVKNYAIKEEPNGSYMAIITFDSPAAAQVSLLLNTAEIGREGEHITVSIIPESEKPSTLDYIPVNNPTSSPSMDESADRQVYHPSEIIKLLIEKGYKLKDDVIELAKQAEPKVKEALHTAGATVATTGQVAYDVTQHQLNRISEVTTEAAQIATAKVSSYVTATVPHSTDGTEEPHSGALDSLKQASEAVINTSQVALDITSNKIKEVSAAVVNTSQVAYDKTTSAIQQSGAVDAIKQAGNAVVNTGQVAMDVTSNVLHQAGSAVVNTGQVAIDVTTNAIQQSGAVDAIKQAGNAVVNTGQVAMDVTSNVLYHAVDVTTNALEQAGSAVVNTSHVAYDTTSNAIQQSGAVDVIKQAGNAVVNTGQVAIDVTTNAIHQTGAVDVIKQAGSAVVNTGQVAIDITANTFSNFINALSPKT
jgi:hypothetical protein